MQPCVQNPTEAQQLPPRVLTAVKSSNLIGYGCLASTEDNPDQGVGVFPSRQKLLYSPPTRLAMRSDPGFQESSGWLG